MIRRLICRLGFHSTVGYGGVVCIYCRGNTRPDEWNLPNHPPVR